MQGKERRKIGKRREGKGRWLAVEEDEGCIVFVFASDHLLSSIDHSARREKANLQKPHPDTVRRTLDQAVRLHSGRSTGNYHLATFSARLCAPASLRSHSFRELMACARIVVGLGR